MWSQVYDPLGNAVLSTLAAAIPVAVMLAALAFFHIKAHIAALLGLAAALLVAIFAYAMPAQTAVSAALYGAANGLLPIGWIILNVIFLYQLTDRKGYFKVLQESITGITTDRRLQLLLVAFSFGAFFEGAGGFGTPVAVTGAMLIGLGFAPLAASGLSLIANTAPVAFGALGSPLIALAGVTGLDLLQLSGMVGRQLPFFSILVPFWLIWAFCGFAGMAAIWPAILVAGAAFAIPQYLISNFHGPWLVDVGASISSMLFLTLFLKVWKPAKIWTNTAGKFKATAGANAPAFANGDEPDPAPIVHNHPRAAVLKAWMPWLILSVLVFLWGIPEWKKMLDGLSVFKYDWPALHKVVQKMPPVASKPTAEAAVYTLNWLSATGSGILAAAIISGLIMGYKVRELFAVYWATIKLLRFSLLTIAAMLALGYTTRYSGLDSTLGLAFSHTGVLYPFFGTLLGWLGVALTGSDTASNVLFGGLQKTSATQLGLNPVLMAAANSSGGVMGKMIDAQSIVVASTATKWYGHEGDILRYVFFHSIALACLVGILVTLQAYVYPFTALVR
ncbi:lactate permease [Massilia sp. WF1]|uniref:L-lactate permease n=1 Tax=unclassified Massilia TaxID=2609279 RepID=UPI00068B1677|nr:MULTISPECIES: L-lactate permease [unclassified Massilia]ALK95797.1 lactate permease [Massilia sp. WG5]KNZ67984.1 lactate permease [Massilia sp. WF1]